MNLNNELKQCPFCNGKTILLKGQTCLDNYVMCLDCGSKTKRYNTKESAIKSWNKRNAWIPCEERLPKENGCYLATVYELDTKRKVVKPRVFKNGHFYKGYCSTILAWQPLPKPYEE